MAMDDSDATYKDREALAQRLRDVIGSEFDTLSRSEVSSALDELADEISGQPTESAVEPGEESESQPVDGSDGSTFLDAFSSAIEPFDLDRDGLRPLVTISPRDGDELTRLLGQLLDVQALWLAIEDPPRLNEEAEILLDLPDFGFELSIIGRVVHRTGYKAAVDLSSMTEDDLESIRQIHRRHDAKEEKRSGDTVQGMGFEARAPSEREVAESWDGNTKSSLALSRTFETATEQDDPYWYGPKSPWLEPADIGADGEVYKDVEPEALLLEVSANQFSGLLEFSAGERRYQLTFDEGYVAGVSARPHEAREELGPMLRVAERVSEDALARASSHAIKREVSLEVALHDLEILTADAIRSASAGRLTYLLRNFCDLEAGTAQLTPEEALPERQDLPDAVRIHAPVESVIFRRRIDEFHQLSPEERDRLIEEDRRAVPVIASAGERRIQRTFSDEAHRSMVATLVDGSRPLSDLIADSFLPPAETVSVLYALRSMSLVDFREDTGEAADISRFADDLHVKHLSVHKASYFEVLNIHWSSYGRAVESAYRWSSAYFDPTRAPDELDRPSQKRLEEISKRIDKAYGILKDRESRHAYRKKIMPEYKLEHSIPLLLDRANLAAEQGDTELALDSFSRVLELDPDNGAAKEAVRELRR